MKKRTQKLLLDTVMIEKAILYLDAYEIDNPSKDLNKVIHYLINLAARAKSGSSIKVK